jgi:hypothetical protein
MREGSMRTSSILAMLAVAGVAMGSTAAIAADLGGNCCADLEERVAELEATTARKGNRKVSLQVYGRVSESIVWWNDGAENNVYVLENNLIKNVLGFRGSAKINSDWSAGFNLEVQVRAYRSSNANQLALGASNNVQIPAYNTQSVSLRIASWYLDSRSYGRVTVGRTPEPMQGTSSVNLASPDGFAGMTGPGYITNGFFLRRAGTTGNSGLSAITWGNGANVRNGDGPASFDYSQTSSGVKYTSPFFLGQTKSSGFRFDTMWGMDDMWSVALRYAETWSQFRVAAAVGYGQWSGPDRGMCSLGAVGNDPNANANPSLAGGPGSNAGSNTDCGAIQASASVMHVPTGLYLSGGGAQLEDKNSQAAFNAKSTLNGASMFGVANRGGNDGKSGVWWVQGGWQAKLNALGNTTFWGQWVQYDLGLGVQNAIVQRVAANDPINSLGANAMMVGAQTRYWGFGVSQNIDAAAMTLYAGFHSGSTEITLASENANLTTNRAKANAIDDFQMFYTGATIRF